MEPDDNRADRALAARDAWVGERHALEAQDREQVLDVLDVEPLGDRVIVEIALSPDRVGLIFLPDARDEKPQEGVVRSVGPDVGDLRPGDRVIFGRYSGTDVQLGPVRSSAPTVVILAEQDVLARLHPGRTHAADLAAEVPA